MMRSSGGFGFWAGFDLPFLGDLDLGGVEPLLDGGTHPESIVTSVRMAAGKKTFLKNGKRIEKNEEDPSKLFWEGIL